MEHKNKSVLQFKRYIVKEICYCTNELCAMHDGISLDFDFDTSTHLSEDNHNMEVELRAVIFKDAEKNDYPFEMSVTIKGFFCLEAEGENVQVFEANAIAILFPYMRAIVSTYTANANVAPVILPPMNINAYLRKKHENQGKGNKQA